MKKKLHEDFLKCGYNSCLDIFHVLSIAEQFALR